MRSFFELASSEDQITQKGFLYEINFFSSLKVLEYKLLLSQHPLIQFFITQKS